MVWKIHAIPEELQSMESLQLRGFVLVVLLGQCELKYRSNGIVEGEVKLFRGTIDSERLHRHHGVVVHASILGLIDWIVTHLV